MTQSNSKKPTHELFHVTGEGEKQFWYKIGAGWENKDGKGVSILRTYHPLVDGREVLRKITPKTEGARS